MCPVLCDGPGRGAVRVGQPVTGLPSPRLQPRRPVARRVVEAEQPRVWWDGTTLFVIFPTAPGWVATVSRHDMARHWAELDTDGCVEYRPVAAGTPT